MSGCACVAHVLRVRSATHARLSRFSTLALRLIISLFQTRSATHVRLSRFSAFALRLLVSCCCQAVARCSRTFLYAPLLVLVFLGFCRLLFGKSPLCKQKSSVQDVQPSTTSVVLFSLSGCGQGAHVLRVRSAPCPRLPRLVRLAPRLVNVWQEITTPLRMLAFRDFQRLLCARLSLCFKHAPRLVLVFLGSCRLLFGKSPLCKQKSSVQDVQQKHGDLPCFLI